MVKGWSNLLLLTLLWANHYSLDALLRNDMSDLTTLLNSLSSLYNYSLWLSWLCGSVLYILSVNLNIQIRNKNIRDSHRDGPDLSASLLDKDLLPLNYLTNRSRNHLPLLLITTMVDWAPFDSLFDHYFQINF